MQMFEARYSFFAVADNGRVAPLPSHDPVVRSRCLEPDTFMRLACLLVWAERGVLARFYPELDGPLTLRWERPDPSWRMYETPERLIAVDQSGDYAVMVRGKIPAAEDVWRDPREFARMNVSGLVSWTHQWKDPDKAREHYRMLVEDVGTLVWEQTV